MQGNIKKNYKPGIPEIRDTGYIYDLDTEGQLINNLDISMIQEKWLKAVNSISLRFQEYFEDNVHSIYVRGSVAHGQSVDNVSDIDIIIILKERIKVEKDTVPILLKVQAERFIAENQEYIDKNFPFITHIDFGKITHLKRILDVGESINANTIQFYIKYLSIHVYGENLQDILPVIKKKDAPMYHNSLMMTINEMKQTPIDMRIHGDLIQWTARRIIRAGFGVVYNKLNVWTRCLVPCYNLFVKEYPEYKKDMKFVLEIAIFGIKDKTRADYKKMLNIGVSLVKLINANENK